MTVRAIVEQVLKRKGEVRTADIAGKTGLSRTYVHRILQVLVREGRVRLVGKANRARYVSAEAGSVRRALAAEHTFHAILQNRALQEDVVFKRIREETGILTGIRKNVERIVEYAFTEMLNNAIEHSKSHTIAAHIERAPTAIWFSIMDRGIGIFKNIMVTRNLEDETAAIQELLKGRQTTAPDRHSGEGIFFSSKAADVLEIKSSDRKVLFDTRVEDVFVRRIKLRKGTQVDFTISLAAKQNLIDIFGHYSDDSYSFDRTRVSVKLYKMDSGFVSRSQARRILSGLEQFRRVVLDFRDVEVVGQGFVDEVFRVWLSRHPDKTIETMNENNDVRFMIDRVRQQG